MKILYSDDAEAIRQYLSTPDGILNINYCRGTTDHDVWRGTPLFEACMENRTDVIDVLIEFGVDVNKQSYLDQETPLFVSCDLGNIDIVSRLLQANADPNIPDSFGTSPIMRAASQGHLDIVKLLTVYTDFNYLSKYGDNIFFYAIYSMNNEIVDYVFDFCTNINYINFDTDDGLSYLHSAVIIKNKYAINLLLAKGADVNIENDIGEKPSDCTTDPEILAMLSQAQN